MPKRVRAVIAKLDAGLTLTRDEARVYVHSVPRTHRITLPPHRIIDLFRGGTLDVHTARLLSTYDLNGGVRALCEANQLTSAIRLVELLTEMGKANQHSYATVLHWWAADGNLLMAKHQYHAWVQAGLLSDMGAVSCAALLKCALASDPARALPLLAYLVDLGAPLTTSCVNGYLHAFAHEGRVQEALDSLALLADAPGHCFEADAFTYEMLFLAAEVGRRLDLVPVIHESMEASGVVPDAKLSALVIKSYGYMGDVETAVSLFLEALPRWRVRTTVYHYNAVMLAFARAGDRSSARDLYTRMRASRITPDTYTFVALLTALARSGDASWSDLSPILADSRDPAVERNTYVRTAAINALRSCRTLTPARRCALALREFKFMREHGVRVTAETVNSLIALHAECDDPHAALDMLGVMAELELEPSQRTYSMLIGMCQDQGLLDKAEEFEVLRATMRELLGTARQNTGKGRPMR